MEEKPNETKPRQLDLNKCDCKLDSASGQIDCKVKDPKLFAEIMESKPRKINFDLELSDNQTKGGEPT